MPPEDGTSKDDLLDFLYLDLPRLSSFASQLFGTMWLPSPRSIRGPGLGDSCLVHI